MYFQFNICLSVSIGVWWNGANLWRTREYPINCIYNALWYPTAYYSILLRTQPMAPTRVYYSTTAMLPRPTVRYHRPSATLPDTLYFLDNLLTYQPYQHLSHAT